VGWLTDGVEVGFGGILEGVDDGNDGVDDGGLALLDDSDLALDNSDLGDGGAGKTGEGEDLGELHLD
jgi:hypothetical protein